MDFQFLIFSLEAAAQLNMYLNYYAAEVNDPDDNPPIGIIICTEKTALIDQVEKILERWYSDKQ